MNTDEKITRALEEKVREQAEALSLWVRREFNLSSEHYVKIKATLSVKKIRVLKPKQDQQDWVFNQQPTSEDWVHVIEEVRTLSVKGKPYQRARRIWEHMVGELNNLQKLTNVGYVSNATRLNVYLKNNNLPYRLIRVDKPGDDTLYSLLVATSATGAP